MRMGSTKARYNTAADIGTLGMKYITYTVSFSILYIFSYYLLWEPIPSEAVTFNVTFSQTYGKEGDNVTFRCEVFPSNTKIGQFFWRKGKKQDNIYYMSNLGGIKKEEKNGQFKDRNVRVMKNEKKGFHEFILFDPMRGDIDIYWCQFHGHFIADTRIASGWMWLAVNATKEPVIFDDNSSISKPLSCPKSATCPVKISKRTKILHCYAFKSRPLSNITWNTGEITNVTLSCDDDSCSATSTVNVTIPGDSDSINVTCHVEIPDVIPKKYIRKNVTVMLVVQKGIPEPHMNTPWIKMLIVLLSLVGILGPLMFIVCKFKNKIGFCKNRKGESERCTYINNENRKGSHDDSPKVTDANGESGIFVCSSTDNKQKRYDDSGIDSDTPLLNRAVAGKSENKKSDVKLE